jgi:hypothetical protein
MIGKNIVVAGNGNPIQENFIRLNSGIHKL